MRCFYLSKNNIKVVLKYTEENKRYMFNRETIHYYFLIVSHNSLGAVEKVNLGCRLKVDLRGLHSCLLTQQTFIK